MADADLYLRRPDDPSDEVLIAGPLLGALRTVLEVERLADAVEQLPDDKPALALLDGTLAFWDLQRGQYPQLRRRRISSQNASSPPWPACERLPPTGVRWRWPPTPPRPSHHRGCWRRAPHALRPVRRRL